jgi:hypothetical protein
MKSIYRGILTLYTIARPRVSEMGAASKGPSARPRTKRERGSKAAGWEIWNLWDMAKTPGVIIEEPAVTLRQRRETGMMWHAFFTVGNLVLCVVCKRGLGGRTSTPVPGILFVSGIVPTDC